MNNWLRAHRPLLVASLVLILAGLFRITYWDIWFDESFTARLIDFPWGEIFSRTADDVHPPLYYFGLKAWASLLGDSLLALRAFSLGAMVAAIWVWFYLIAELFDRKTANWSLPLLISSPFMFKYAQEMRMYTFAAIFVGLASLALIKLQQKGFKYGNWWWIYGLSLAAGFYVHNMMVLLLPAHITVLIFE